MNTEAILLKVGIENELGKMFVPFGYKIVFSEGKITDSFFTKQDGLVILHRANKEEKIEDELFTFLKDQILSRNIPNDNLELYSCIADRGRRKEEFRRTDLFVCIFPRSMQFPLPFAGIFYKQEREYYPCIDLAGAFKFLQQLTADGLCTPGEAVLMFSELFDHHLPVDKYDYKKRLSQDSEAQEAFVNHLQKLGKMIDDLVREIFAGVSCDPILSSKKWAVPKILEWLDQRVKGSISSIIGQEEGSEGKEDKKEAQADPDSKVKTA